MSTSNQALVQRADMALADMAQNGGLLDAEQANTFIDYVTEETSILPQARIIRMSAPTRKVNRLGFDSRILRAARQIGSARDDGGNDRYVRADDRAAPSTKQIELVTAENIAEVRIPYEMLEDNIEGQSFETHMIRLIAKQAGLDLEEQALWADTSSSDPFLALHDGWMKRVGTEGNVLDWNNAGVNSDMFAEAQLVIPQKYHRNLPHMRAWISHANRIKYLQILARRGTNLGDAAIQQDLPVVAHGLRAEASHGLGHHGGQRGLVTIPQNLLFGIQRDITIESDKDIRSREYIIVVTMRTAVGIEDVEAAALIENIGGLNRNDLAQEIRVVNTAANPVPTKEVA